MATFIPGEGLKLNEEDSNILSECQSFVSAPKFDSRRLNLTKNLSQAIEDCFVGWEIK